MFDTHICRYDSDLKDQLVEFLGFKWNDLNINERRERFEWTYENNPYTKTPFIYIALQGERIIAQRSFVIQKFICNNDEFLVGVPADAIVHPDFRRRGLFAKLTDYAFNDMVSNSNIRLLLSLSSNEASTPGNIKYGFVPVGKREYMHFFSPINGLKKKLQPDENLDNIIVSQKNGVTIEITRELRIRQISNFMRRFVEKDKIHNVRDNDFYAWQFTDNPNEYIYAYSKEDNGITSYLSLRKSGNKYYLLMEYGYLDPTHFKYLIEETSKRVLASRITVPVFTRSQKEILELKRSGFIDSNNKGLQLIRALKFTSRNKLPGALVKPISVDSNDNAYFIDGVDIRLDKNWSLFQSDVW